MRDRGLVCEVTEHWNSFAKIRKDLMGFCDVLALGQMPNGEFAAIAVQTTSATNMAARVTKIRNEPKSEMWLKAGNKIEVHGWKQSQKDKKKLWHCTVKEISLEI